MVVHTLVRVAANQACAQFFTSMPDSIVHLIESEMQ
jgi:hypothetical protein